MNRQASLLSFDHAAGHGVGGEPGLVEGIGDHRAARATATDDDDGSVLVQLIQPGTQLAHRDVQGGGGHALVDLEVLADIEDLLISVAFLGFGDGDFCHGVLFQDRPG